MYSKNNNNIITHLSNGKPVARDKNKDFIANYRPEEEFLCWKAAVWLWSNYLFNPKTQNGNG